MTEPNGANGRDRSGRFTLGCSGGPGNPRLRALAAHQQAIADALTPEQVGEVVRSLYAGALAGDTLAAKALLDRIAGKPAEAPAVVNVGEVNADTLHHGDGVADLGARLLAAAAAGEVDLRDAERLLLLLDRLGAARDGWGRRPDALAMAQRAQDGTP